MTNVQELAQNLKLDLPAYAKPLFIRLMPELEHTGTFKAIKNSLVDDGFNVKKLTDVVYYFDPKDQNYKELTIEVYENILNCDFRL